MQWLTVPLFSHCPAFQANVRTISVSSSKWMPKNFWYLSVLTEIFMKMWRGEPGSLDHTVLSQARILPQLVWDSWDANIATLPATKRAFQSVYEVICRSISSETGGLGTYWFYISPWKMRIEKRLGAVYRVIHAGRLVDHVSARNPAGYVVLALQEEH